MQSAEEKAVNELNKAHGKNVQNNTYRPILLFIPVSVSGVSCSLGIAQLPVRLPVMSPM